MGNPGDMGVPLQGHQQDVQRLPAESFQFRGRGTAAAKVMEDFFFQADAPAEYLTFRVVAQQRQIPGQVDMYPTEGF